MDGLTPAAILVACAIALTLYGGYEVVKGVEHLAHATTHAMHHLLHPHEKKDAGQ